MKKSDHSKLFLLIAAIAFVGACGFYVYQTSAIQNSTAQHAKGERMDFSIFDKLFGGSKKSNSTTGSNSAPVTLKYRVGDITKYDGTYHKFDPQNINGDQFAAFVAIYGANKLNSEDYQNILDTSEDTTYLSVSGSYDKESGKTQFLITPAQTEAYTGYYVVNRNLIEFINVTGSNPMHMKDKVLGRASVHQILTYVQQKYSKADIKEIVNRVNNDENLRIRNSRNE